MIDYSTLKNSYIAAIQTGIMMGVNYEDTNRVNKTLHHFCKACVENSSYSEQEKHNMKLELEAIKEAFAREIEHRAEEISG